MVATEIDVTPLKKSRREDPVVFFLDFRMMFSLS